MARFFGEVGYGHTTEGAAGVYKDIITERQYYGDIEQNGRRMLEGQEVNSNLTLDFSVSIVADEYASENINAIRYVRWAGSLWAVTTANIRRPRLILRLGGVYNGPFATPVTP